MDLTQENKFLELIYIKIQKDLDNFPKITFMIRLFSKCISLKTFLQCDTCPGILVLSWNFEEK